MSAQFFIQRTNGKNAAHAKKGRRRRCSVVRACSAMQQSSSGVGGSGIVGIGMRLRVRRVQNHQNGTTRTSTHAHHVQRS